MMIKAVVLTCLVAAVAAQTLIPDHARAALDASLVDEVNSANAGWTAGHNSYFDGKSIADVKAMLGVEPMSELERTMWPAFEETEGYEAPEAFDAREAWPKCALPVRNQGHCGSCWAFGAAEALTDRFCIATDGASPILSPQDLVSCDHVPNMGCNGGTISPTWAYMGLSGIVSDSCFPYTSGEKGEEPSCISKCEDGSAWKKYKVHPTSIRVHFSVKASMEDIATNGPIEAAFSVYRDFLAYKSGVYKHTTGELLGGHAIKMIGWGNEGGEDYWIIQNSWTDTWGDHGFFKILKGKNECGIEGSCTSGKPNTD